jgi:hypothetical protein
MGLTISWCSYEQPAASLESSKAADCSIDHRRILMTAEELKTLLSTPAALFLVMLLGSLASMLKQVSDAKKNGATTTSLSSYLAHWPETLGTVITNALGFLTLVVTDQLNFASALGIGYAANSAADLLRSGGRSASLVKGQQAGFARPLMLVVLLAIALAPLLHGCAALGVPTPQTFSERLAAGYVSVTTTRQTATILLNGQVITSADATNIQKQADVAREGLDVARTLQGIDAQKKLDATLLILDTAHSYLCAKAPTNPNCQR